MNGQSDSPRRLLVLWSAHAGRSRAELERWAREQLPMLRSAGGVHEVWLRRVSPPSPRRGVDWDWAFELRVRHDAVAELCDRGACGDLLADMRLLGMRPVAMLLDCESD
jgi:hypothetical protein